MRVWQPVVFAGLIASVAVGCGQSPPPPPGGAPPGDAPKGDPNATYTITWRDKHAGEKYEVTRTTEQDFFLSEPGPNKEPVMRLERVAGKFVFTEEVEAVADGTPTKARRAYTTAETRVVRTTNLSSPGEKPAEGGAKARVLAFGGKTVRIERRPGRPYSYVLDGGGTLGDDVKELEAEFGGVVRPSLQTLLPARPVKVDEEWSFDPARLDAFLMPGGKDKGTDERKTSGKLTRVYSRDGKQCGAFVIRIESKGAKPGGKMGGGVLEIVYDGCIDGSAADGTRRAATTLSVPDVTGKSDRPVDVTNVVETVLKTVK